MTQYTTGFQLYTTKENRRKKIRRANESALKKGWCFPSKLIGYVERKGKEKVGE